MKRALAGALLATIALATIAPLAVRGGMAIYQALQARQGELEPFNTEAP